MMYLITGMPGNGKTLYAVNWIINQIEIDKAQVKKGSAPRNFFTDIDGFDYDAVEKLTGYRVEPAPEDWRDSPQGSVIVYDEAHRRFPSTGKPGRCEDVRVREMDTHRHGGYDLMFITQWPSKVHHELRQLVGEHVHLNRAMGLEKAGLFRWPRVQSDPYDERQREKAEEEIWSFPKECYDLYTSSTLHTTSHKFKIPKKVWSTLSYIVMVALILWGVFSWVMKDAPKKSTDSTSEQRQGGADLSAPAALLSQIAIPSPVVTDKPPLLPGTGQYFAINTQPAPSLAGCAASEKRCRCYSTKGELIDMSVSECRQLLENPLPFNIYHEYAQSSDNLRLIEE